MDMKKILQAVDGASSKKPAGGSDDMKKFMQIVEGKGPLNRLTAAESMAMQSAEKKKTITNPVLNVKENAKPSMIGKYFKSINEELLEAEQRQKERAKRIAERVIERVTPGQETPPGINRLTGKPNEPTPPQGGNVIPKASVILGGKEYAVVLQGDIRSRYSPGPGTPRVTASGYIEDGVITLTIDPPKMEEGVAGPKNCWPGHRKVGTKPGTGKNAGKRVNDCEKIGEDDVEESGLQYYTGKKKYGADGMKALAAAGRKGASQEDLGRIKDKYMKKDESVQKKGPAGQLKAKAKPDVKGTVLGSKEKSQKGLRGKLVGGGA